MADEEKKSELPWGNTQLRTDGPTLAQYVAAGYSAESYPPQGYAVREEVDPAQAAEAALKAKEAQHIENSVQPQLTEIEKQVQARLAAEAQRQKDEDVAADDARRQREADEKIVTGEEGNGISHMDLLRASFEIDGQLSGEPIAEPNFHQPQPENHEPKPVKWEPGK